MRNALMQAVLAVLLVASAGRSMSRADAANAVKFGRVDNHDVELYTLTNRHGIEAQIMTYGATLVSLKTPDRSGQLQNIVLGFDTWAGYGAGVPYYGATVGRYANRIAHGRFELDGKVFQLPLNDGQNSLHGGVRGFDKRVWSVARNAHDAPGRLRLCYVSPAGEEGYPGELRVTVIYTLSEDDSLEITYEATAGAATPVNLTNHSYFNLTGDPSQRIEGHLLQIDADYFTPVDSALIPSGELRAVAGTPFDFREPAAIGSRIGDDDEQLARGHGYDHNWVLNKSGTTRLHVAARLADPVSGRVLDVRTTQPGLQVYTGNFLNGKPFGQGTVYGYRTAVCLETQHFPDSPNHAEFPNTILRPGKKYREQTVFRFLTLTGAR